MKNIYQIIHIVGAVQGFYLFILLVMRKENKLANKLLASLLLIISISLTAAFLHTNNYEINDFKAICRSDMFIFTYGPLIAFYTLFLTGFKERLNPVYILHMLPAMMLFSLFAMNLTSYGEFSLSHVFEIWDEGNPISLRIWYVIHSAALMHLSAYLVYALIITNRYRKKLSEYFSQGGRIYLKWLSIILLGIVFICIFAILQFLFNAFKDTEGILQWIISVSTLLLVFMIGYFTSTQPDILEDLKAMNRSLAEVGTDSNTGADNKTLAEAEKGKPAKYERNRLGEKEEKIHLQKLLEYVKENKPYLDPEINLRKLSEEVGIPSHLLSMLLSIYLEQNFYTFINKYRVEEAKKKLQAKDSKEYNILAIAFDTGFNSKSTFNLVFKKLEGITPSEFRAKCRGEVQKNDKFIPN